MKQDDLGNPMAPRKEVVSYNGLGWIAVTNKKRAVVGFAYRYSCKLECGHEQEFISKTFPQTKGDHVAPSFMNCEKCHELRNAPPPAW